MTDRHQGGFTTVDFVMMLTVLVLLSAVTFPTALSTLRTYQRTLGARQVLAEVRQVQSIAVARGQSYGFQWGGDPSMGLTDGHYRIARDTTDECDFPDRTAPLDGTDVVRDWNDLDDDYPGIRIAAIVDRNGGSVGEIVFDRLGASINPCESVAFPVTIVVADRGGRTETIEVTKSGLARMP
jgi:hypothetical protein